MESTVITDTAFQVEIHITVPKWAVGIMIEYHYVHVSMCISVWILQTWIDF